SLSRRPSICGGLDLFSGLRDLAFELLRRLRRFSLEGRLRGFELLHLRLESLELRILPRDLGSLRLRDFSGLREFLLQFLFAGFRLGLQSGDLGLPADGLLRSLRFRRLSTEGFAGPFAESHLDHSSRLSRIFS